MLETSIRILNKSYLIRGDDRYLAPMNGHFEAHLEAVFQKLINKDDVVLDIGANVGLTAIAFSELADIVHAFEPTPSTFESLITNVEKAKLENIYLHNLGLGSGNKNLSVTYCKDGNNAAFVNDKTQLMGNHITEEVVIRTLDGFLEEYQLAPSFIKIDVEGYELEVIKGSLRALHRFQPIVFLEMNHFCLNVLHRITLPDFIDSLSEIFAFMYAVDDTGEVLALHHGESRFEAMYQNAVHNRFMNVICGFDAPKKAHTFLNGSGLKLLKQGWSYPEKEFTWSDGKTAKMEISNTDIRAQNRNLVIVLEVTPFLTKGIVEQRVDVYANKTAISKETVSYYRRVIVVVPRDINAHKILEIELRLSHSDSPLNQGVSNDSRVLGLALRSVELVSY